MLKTLPSLEGNAGSLASGLRSVEEARDSLPRDSRLSITSTLAREGDRRTFLKLASVPCMAACATSCLGAWSCFALDAASPPDAEDSRFVVEARFYEKLPYKKTRCKLCPRECVIDDRERGYCGVRENRGGNYYTLVYSRVCAAHVDPIEKKPFFHYYPGTMAFSVATAGCNVNCKMCQNWDISQSRPEQVRSTYLSPKDLASLAQQYRCPSIAYTYSEPVVFSEYVLDAAAAGHALGIKSAVVTGGFIQQEPLKKLCQGVDAIKVDLKAFSEKYYKEVVNGELKPVLEALVTMRKLGMWNEIVYLVVPTLNDSESEFRALAQWVKGNLGVDVPLHFSRFYPQYLLKNLPPTPLETLERAKAIADAEGLHYVYLGNIPGHPAESTYCPKCRRTVIGRVGFTVTEMHLRKGQCEYCQQTIPGVWQT
jgi:pyruvate formate lyase activating enzyme